MTGDSIVFPDEFTKLTGSDFDVDKAFFAIFEYSNIFDHTIDGISHGIHRKEIDTTKTLTQQDPGALKNRILQNFIRILTTKRIQDQLK